MKELSDNFKFDQGLRKVADQPRNSGGLIELYNLKPWNNRLTSIVPIVNPITGLVMDWPFPQLFCLYERNYLLGRSSLELLDVDWDTTNTVACTSHTGIWHVADFQDYIVMCNGTQTFETDTTTGIPVASLTLPVMGCVCNFKGQLVAGGVVGYDPNAVVWGEIGWSSLAIDRNNIAGNRKMPWQGSIHTIKRLGDRLVVYGDGGVAVLQAEREPAPTFRLRETLDFGVLSVCGDIHEHVMLSEGGILWKLKEDLTIEELGYQEFGLDLIASSTQIMGSFDSHYRDFYFSDGTQTLLLTRHGLCHTYQLISSAAFYAGGLIGTFSSLADMSGKFQLDTADFNLAGRKTITNLHLGMTGSGVSMYTDMRQNKGSSFIRTPSIPLNIDGTCNLKACASDFRIGAAMPTFADKTFDWMRFNYQTDDKRFLRGLYARQTVGGSDK